MTGVAVISLVDIRMHDINIAGGKGAGRFSKGDTDAQEKYHKQYNAKASLGW